MELGLAAGAEEKRQVAVGTVTSLQLGTFVVLRLEPGHRGDALLDERGVAVHTLDHGADIENLDTRRIEIEDVLQKFHRRFSVVRVGRQVFATTGNPVVGWVFRSDQSKQITNPRSHR